jgi:hypothetical protein
MSFLLDGVHSNRTILAEEFFCQLMRGARANALNNDVRETGNVAFISTVEVTAILTNPIKAGQTRGILVAILKGRRLEQ